MKAHLSLMGAVRPKIKKIITMPIGVFKPPILIFLIFLCFVFAAKAQDVEVQSTPVAKAVTITGAVVSIETGEPLEGATLKVIGTNITTITSSKGDFKIIHRLANGILKVSFMGYKTKEIFFKNTIQSLAVRLERDLGELEEVEINTGYQYIPKERTTGSFEYVGNQLLERRISSNIMDKIENVVSGFYTNGGELSPDRFSIRGRSTLYADATPLIVIDNFQYEGSIDDINPNDIESISVLKDAAAASIWGARAGNGVIVITTKKGKTLKPRLEFGNSFTIVDKPKIEKLPVVSSTDFIELEKELFDLGFYAADENYNSQGIIFPASTPVVELLRMKKNEPEIALLIDRKIEGYKNANMLEGLKELFYRRNLTNRHALNIGGNTPRLNYYFSVGFDKDRSFLVGQDHQRFSLRNRNVVRLNDKISVETGITFLNDRSRNGNNLGYNMHGKSKKLYPYAKFSDEKGKSLPIDWEYSRAFIESAEQKGLLDWEYKPLDDIYTRERKASTKEILFNLGTDYQVHRDIRFLARYQYFTSESNAHDNYGKDSYYTRDLINNYTQISDGVIARPIPLGDIIITNYLQAISHQGRIQLVYDHKWKTEHHVSGIAGWEIRGLTSIGENNNFYGYNANGSVVSTNMDFKNTFPQYYYNRLRPSIPNLQSVSKEVDRYYSYYANGSYTYQNKYMLSASIRVDASNLFGVKFNQKEVPLWSTGAKWQINEESFYKIDWLSSLALRITFGLQGNVSKQVSAYTTGRYDGYSSNTGLLYMSIRTPPNESLKWEKVNQLNLGLDFKIRRSLLTGSLEFYVKKGNDLLGSSPLDPTTGFAINDGTPRHYTNVAGMRGNGIDIRLESTITNRSLVWKVNTLYSYTLPKVSRYAVPVSNYGSAYLTDFQINPVLTKPIYSIYGFPWAGLDPLNGNPQGFLEGEVSTDYSSIVNSTVLSDMKAYSMQPTSFGSIRNNFVWRKLSFSFSLSYKLGYYFRNISINYDQLMNQWTGHSDFSKRWRVSGDELYTHVPSFVYPNNSSRETFYRYADILIEKGDHVRLEDITFGYTISKGAHLLLPVESIILTSYITNLGTLWKANDIDPGFVLGLKQSTSFSFGLNVIF